MACTSWGSAIPGWDGFPRSIWMSLAEGPASTLKRRDDERRSTWIWGLVCGLLLLGAIVLGASAIQVAGRSGGGRGGRRGNAGAGRAGARGGRGGGGARRPPTRAPPPRTGGR